MSRLGKYDLTRLSGVAIISFVFIMTILRAAGFQGLSFQEFSTLLKLAGVLLGGHELARLRTRRDFSSGDNDSGSSDGED